MHALAVTQPAPDSSTTQVIDIDPPHCSEGQLLLDVEAAGINFLDVLERRGTPGYVPSWPWVPGAEVVGIVRDVGVAVPHSLVGTRVAAFVEGGGLAETAVARADLAVAVPDGVDATMAAAVPLSLTTALLLLTQSARFRAGDTVLVHSAAGGVGASIARLLPILGGGRLIGTVGRPESLGDALAVGYDEVLVRDRVLVDTVLSLAPAGVDVVLDPLGGFLAADMEMSAVGGTVVLFGNASGDPLPDLPSPIRLIVRNAAVAGFNISGVAARRPAAIRQTMTQLLDWMAAGMLDLPVHVVDGLESVPRVHDRLAGGMSRGKHVVRPGGSRPARMEDVRSEGTADSGTRE